MTCGAFRHRVPLMLEGAIEGGDLAAHAAGCRPCARHLEGSRQVLRLLTRPDGRGPDPAPPSDLSERIVTRLPRSRPPATTAGVVTSAGGVLAVLVAFRLAGGRSSMGGDPLMAGVRAAADTAGSWLARFATLGETTALTAPVPGLALAGLDPLSLAGLVLVAAGVAGMAAGVALGGLRAAFRARRAG